MKIEQHSTQTPLTLIGLTKSFGSSHVLQDTNLILQAGDIVGLVGGNGAGKSTLLRAAVGIDPADEGQALIFGENSSRLSDASKARIAYAPQDANLFGWLCGREVFALMQTVYPRWKSAEALALANQWNVPLDVLISELSPGQRQRLQIVRTLATQAELLILDEPVASLDPAGRRQFLSELLGRCAETATTVLFSSHIVSDLERCASKVAILKHGKIILFEELDSLKSSLFQITIPAAVEKQFFALDIKILKSLKISNTDLLLTVKSGFDELSSALSVCRIDGRPNSVGLEDFLVAISR